MTAKVPVFRLDPFSLLHENAREHANAYLKYANPCYSKATTTSWGLAVQIFVFHVQNDTSASLRCNVQI